jgi:hypothetical protein
VGLKAKSCSFFNRTCYKERDTLLSVMAILESDFV